MRHLTVKLTASCLLAIAFMTTPALADVDIYRGVDANQNTGRASLAPSQFRFNPDLSTFNNPANAPVQKSCNFRFTVTLAGNPQQGANGPVVGLPGYTATFDNNPQGHWGIIHPTNVTADQAKQAVADYAQANRGRVVNGALNNCN
ncbi:hypothetical protein TH25_20890 [Thalassospira profundimaris]|uniref:Uncharacterized protein n=1 Tax=Thalassospira profundimaris TaxID=502049 RepID=A0A367WQZ9_9PROT|nr:hypothetical protein [Thalassospira profundimaris]RCK43896.1 hypothetical protein TH25_20890 [Thalassospira profundimaris]